MTDFESIKPQLDAMHQMYQAAFEEGRRSAFREMAPELTKLQQQFERLHPKFNHTRELTPSQNSKEINHGTESDQA